MMMGVYVPLVIRHVLMMLGAVLVSKGILDASTTETVVGSLIAAASLVWSYMEKPTMDVQTFIGLLVRHIGSAAGAVLMTFGYVDAQTAATLTGAAVSLATMTWSGVNKSNR